MERSGPPGGDEDFEWTDSPARDRPDPSTGDREAPGTGERRAVGRDTGSFQAIREGVAERRREPEETGKFERSGRRPPRGRRSRRRDLPARVRRRQDVIVGALAALVIVGLIVLITIGEGEGSEQTIGLKRLIGQSIVARLGAQGPDPDLTQR